MNIRNVLKTLPLLTKHDIVPCYWGGQGKGKTQTMKQFASANSLGFVHLHLATQEVGDLVGLLVKRDDGTVYHAVPEWFPTEAAIKAGRYPAQGIVFLDEINRAHPDVIQCCFSLITEKTIHTHKLPPGWKIVAACNYQSNEFNVTDTSDAAWLSRFCHIDFQPDVAEFVDYADSLGADTVAAFIQDNPACLETSKDGLDYKFITPDRRAYISMISKLETEDLGENTFEIYKGCIGQGAAAALMSHKKKKEKSIRIMDVLKRYPSVKEEVKTISKSKKGGEARFDLLNSAIEELFIKLEKKPETLEETNFLPNLQDFLTDIPLELTMKVFNWMNDKTFFGKDAILNNKAFLDKVAKKEGKVGKTKAA